MVTCTVKIWRYTKGGLIYGIFAVFLVPCSFQSLASTGCMMISASQRLACFFLIAVAGPATGQNVSFTTLSTTAYGAQDTNSCSIAINNITTVGDKQFIGYYDNSGAVMIGRRTVGASTWQNFNSGLSATTAQMADDHNIIALSVDTTGRMHVSWNMHNQSLNYAISNASVTGTTLSSVAFTTQTSANAPTLFPNAGATASSVTYPVFLKNPSTNQFVFMYRNGGTGGGSGNGDQYFNNYNPTTHAWTNTKVINGIANSVNAYINSPVYDSQNNLHITWTWRATSNWQTNSNIMYAQSPDNGTTWYKQGGTVQYGLPMIQSGTPVNAVAQIVKTIPQNSSFINQTSMAMDNLNRPIVATTMASNWNPSTSTGDPNRQYVVTYYNGSQWLTSQITHRTSDTSIDTSGANVRDLGRPIVLVDAANRVLVVTRSEDTAMGAYKTASTPNNNLVVYWSDNLFTTTPTWNTIVLDTANLGAYEPTFDAELWKTQHKLSLVYATVGLTGETATTLKVLDWNETAYFAAIPEPTALMLIATIGLLARWRIRTI